MFISLNDEEIQELESQLASVYKPIGPRQEFIDQLRDRIMDPAPRVLKAQSYSIDWRFTSLVIGVLAVLSFVSFIIWKLFLIQFHKNRS